MHTAQARTLDRFDEYMPNGSKDAEVRKGDSMPFGG